MERMLTGLQPTGSITLGNYIGSIKQMIEYQDKYDSYIFIADMHAITVPQEPEKLASNIKNLIAIYLACGLDPNKNTIFLQSDNIYHANVSWILECLTPYGELGRMTQFKDKSRKHQNFSAGLLTYPVLMASDILIYDADFVPTGQDQKQHVELARNIAERVNKKYNKNIFRIPNPLIPTEGAKIMDLVDPTKKMSKSEENPKGVIYLLDEESVIRKKIMGATTDSEMSVKFDFENKPGISNLISLICVVDNMTIEEANRKYKDYNYKDFKTEVADTICNFIKNIQDKFYEYRYNEEYLRNILASGANKARKIANKKMIEVKEKLGLKI